MSHEHGQPRRGDPGFGALLERLHEMNVSAIDLPTSYHPLVREMTDSEWRDHWAIDPSPDPALDYRLDDMDRLCGPVADEFSISELGLHVVSGSFVVVTQFRYLADGETFESRREESIAVANAMIEHWGDEFSAAPREREWIVLNSDTRGPHLGGVDVGSFPRAHIRRLNEWSVLRRYDDEWRIERFLPNAEAVVAWVRSRPGRVITDAIKITRSTFADGERGFAIVAGDEVYVSDERVKDAFETILSDGGLLGSTGLLTYWVNWHGSHSSYDAEPYAGSLDGLIRLTVEHARPSGPLLGWPNSPIATPPWIAAIVSRYMTS